MTSFQPPCDLCGGRCCHYVAIEIDSPTTKSAVDHMRWYLLHKNVHIFQDHDSNWYVEFRTPCEYQDDGGRCTIYEERPKICRDHGNEEGECEYYDSPYRYYFTRVDELEDYLEERGFNWRFKRLN